jgi:hypothetical protein
LVLLLVPLLAWIGLVVHEAYRIAPPAEVRTLAGFLAVMRPPDEFKVVEVRGQEYLMAVGPLRALITFPSGPPAYVFDRTGALVDYSFDTGDAPDFVDRWRFYSSGRPLSRDGATAWVGVRE